ncbi:MAG: sugar transferase [Syntrophobacteraceae bacterium]
MWVPPERSQSVKDLEAAIPYYSARHSVRPGTTGWAQVNLPYGAFIQDSLRKLECDLYYVKNNFNLSKSSANLGISRPNLHDLMEKLGFRKEARSSGRFP